MTTNGAVPVDTFDINCGAVIFAVARILAVPKLPTLALPVAFNVPVTLIPVPVAINTFAFPATPTVTLPLLVAIATLLVPLLIDAPPPPPD